MLIKIYYVYEKNLLFVVALFATIGLWAQKVIYYTAPRKLSTTTVANNAGIHTNAFNTTISTHNFSSGVGTLTFKANVRTIGYRAFYGCSLTSVTLPSTVTTIGLCAFCSTKLTSITIPEGVTSIGGEAFSNCNLDTLTVPSTVSSIGADAFNGITNVMYSGSATGSPWGAKCINGFVEGSLIYESSEKTQLLGCVKTTTGEIVIPNTVTTIANNAFEGCSSITSVTIPEGVTSIGERAFYGCSSLNSITIPSSVKSIGSYAFCGCTSLPEFDNIRYADTYLVEVTNKELTSYTIKAGTKWIGSSAFSNCFHFTSITIPSTVIGIGLGAFYNCTQLSVITVESGNTHYSSSADGVLFNYAKDTLIQYPIGNTCTAYTIPDGVVSIDDQAFAYCTNIAEIILPPTLTHIEGQAFYGCSNLKTVHNKSSLTIRKGYEDNGWVGYYADNVFNGLIVGDFVIKQDTILTGYLGTDTEITIPSNIKIIANGVFAYKSYIVSITIPEGVTSIGTSAFQGCGLRSIILPSSLKAIGHYAFNGCNMTSIVIPSSVTYVGNYIVNTVDTVTIHSQEIVSCIDWSLRTCFGEQVKHYIFGDEIQNIGPAACENCSTLVSVTLPSTLQSIGSYAFSNCTGIIDFVIPDGVTAIGSYAFNNLLNIVYHGTATGSPWGALCVNGYTDKYILYTDSTKTVVEKCLPTAKGRITLNDNVTAIKTLAFSQCSEITSIVIPPSLKKIGSNAFSGCSKLKQVDITDLSAWCKINFEVFSNPLSIATYFCLNGNHIYNLVIPKDVDSIGHYAFYEFKGFSSVTIHDSLKYIGYDAFNSCTNLTSVKITDLSAWCAIEFADEQANPLHIAKYLYLNNNKVTALAIPDSVKSIGQYAFYNCADLKSVTIPRSVETIGNHAFYLYASPDSVKISDIAAWCNMSFSNTYAHPMYKCRNLYLNDNLITNLVIPDSVTQIKTYTFYNCTCFKSVECPTELTKIDANAFYGCSNITSLTVSNSTYLNSNAFYDLTIDTINVLINPFEDEDISYSIKDATKFPSYYYASPVYNKMAKYVKRSLVSPSCATLTIDLSKVKTSKYTKMSLDFGDKEFALTEGVNTIRVTGLHPGKKNQLRFYSQVSGSSEWRDGNITIIPTPALKLTTLNPKIPAKCEAIVCAETNLANDETNAGFEWRKYYAPKEVLSKSAKAYVCNGSLQGKIKDMAEEYYNVRAYYETADSTRYWGEWMTFDPTEFSYFDPEVQTYYITDELTTNQATLRGFVMAGTDDIDKQGFEYWPNTNNAPSRADAAKDVKVVYATGQVMMATIKDLAYNTSYSFRAFAKTTNGNTTYGQEITFTTPKKLFPIRTLTLNAKTGGTVKASPVGPYREQDEIQISAIADFGYHFTKWTDGDVNNPRTFILTKDTAFTAEFAVNQYKVQVNAENGSVTGEGTYTHGNLVTLTATPDYGYHFTQWSDGVKLNPRQFIVTQDTTLAIQFTPNQYSVQVMAENGSVSGAGIHNFGDTVTLTATADFDYYFSKWTDGNTDNPRKFKLTQDTIFEAVFKKIYHGVCSLDAGWNWISIPVQTASTNINLSAITTGYTFTNNNDFIKCGDLSQSYEDSKWMGNPLTFDQKHIYMLKVQNAGTLAFSGPMPENKSLTLNPKWNYLPYWFDQSQTVDDAMADFSSYAQEGDIIKTYTAFATFDNQGKWTGTLSQLDPGVGYMLYRNGLGAVTFQYPSVASGSAPMRRATLPEDIHTLTSNPMPIIATAADVQEGDQLTIYSGKEKVGYSTANKEGLFYVMSYASEGANLHFVVETQSGTYTSQPQVVQASEQPSVGTVAKPYIITFDDNTVRKIIVNGHVYIQRGNELYDVTGAMVQ